MSARVDSAGLPGYDASEPFATRGADASTGECFDVAECFAEVTPAAVDLASCSFATSNETAQTNALNVALRFRRGGSGVCTDDACFVALDAGDTGWTLAEGSVQLPAATCAERAPFTVVYSTGCSTKTSAVPICWRQPGQETGSATNAASTASGAPAAAANSIPPAIGTACEPPSSEGCGMCGMHTRTCRGGRWSEWSECIGRGVCEAGAEEICENGGTRGCRGDCQWGECEGKRCEGLATQTCAKCGTQHRTCLNGTWSDWSACGSQGECEPDDTETCGAGGARVCEGMCRWGECGDQICSGKPSQTCGRCGTQRRTCDAATGAWSDWGACEDQGECERDKTKSCGEQGTSTCLGNCTWDAVCRGQACIGMGSMPCERCGTRTRSCDTDRGVWSEWSECRNQGECGQNETRACGMQGEETCTGSCRWSGECTGQVCVGESIRNCERCGTQTRRCDTASGSWSAWSSCTGQGACEANTTGACGANGTHACGVNCQWGPCTGQDCAEELEQSCGRCGQQRRSCDSNTGMVSEWSACMNQGPCSANQTQACGGRGRQTCSSTCSWGACDCGTGSALCGDTCADLATDPRNCGSCGKACSATQACEKGSCVEQCRPPKTQCDAATCADLQTDALHCGACNIACETGMICEKGQCVIDCKPPESRCNAVCLNLTNDPNHCGSCLEACPRPDPKIGMATCTNSKCGVTCLPMPEAEITACGSECVDILSNNKHCGACDRLCSTQCTGGKCPPKPIDGAVDAGGISINPG